MVKEKIETAPQSLMEVLRCVPDPRSAHGRRHPMGAILALAVCAMLCGARSLYAISQWGRDQDREMAQALGFTRDRTPCVSTLHQVFSRLDRERFEWALGGWLQQRGLQGPEAIAVARGDSSGRKDSPGHPRRGVARCPFGCGLRAPVGHCGGAAPSVSG